MREGAAAVGCLEYISIHTVTATYEGVGGDSVATGATDWVGVVGPTEGK